jgi:hypothetical protein
MNRFNTSDISTYRDILIPDRNKTSIFQIPNVGYFNNTYITNKKRRNEIQRAHELMWAGFGVILEPFNKYYKYRRVLFPPKWKYLINYQDEYRRHGWFIDEYGDKAVELFVDEYPGNSRNPNNPGKTMYCRIKFIKCIANV